MGEWKDWLAGNGAVSWVVRLGGRRVRRPRETDGCEWLADLKDLWWVLREWIVGDEGWGAGLECVIVGDKE